MKFYILGLGLLVGGIFVRAMEDKDAFLAYIAAQKNKILLLKKVTFVAQLIPFLDSAIENKVSREIQSRGYDEFSQKIVRFGIDYLSKNSDQPFYNFLDEPTEECIEYIQKGRDYIHHQLEQSFVDSISNQGKNVIVKSLYIHFIKFCCADKDIRKILKQGMNKDLVYQEIHNPDLYFFLNMYLEYIITKVDTIQNQ